MSSERERERVTHELFFRVVNNQHIDSNQSRERRRKNGRRWSKKKYFYLEYISSRKKILR